MFEDVPGYGFEIFDLLVQRGLGDNSRVAEVAILLSDIPGSGLPFSCSPGSVRVLLVLPFLRTFACNVKENEKFYPRSSGDFVVAANLCLLSILEELVDLFVPGLAVHEPVFPGGVRD